MDCKYCECEILSEEINRYCSTECQEKAKIHREIIRFITYSTEDVAVIEELQTILHTYMREVYEYKGENNET